MLTTYQGPATEAEKAFNHAHTKPRARFQMAFSQLKTMFQYLKSVRVTTLVCAVMHNIATLSQDRLPIMLLEEQYKDIDPAPQETADGRTVRDLYKNTCFSNPHFIHGHSVCFGVKPCI